MATDRKIVGFTDKNGFKKVELFRGEVPGNPTDIFHVQTTDGVVSFFTLVDAKRDFEWKLLQGKTPSVFVNGLELPLFCVQARALIDGFLA